MMRSNIIKIGSRTSALAMQQAQTIAKALQECGLIVEIHGITTQGDIHKAQALHTLEGQNFFSKEIEIALLQETIDCAVHCLKDLSVERPQGLEIAAITERKNPRDMVLLNEEGWYKLCHQQPICLGTSSPRREVLVPPFLTTLYPYLGEPDQCSIVTLRGNVPTRLKQLVSPSQLDGIILAVAGMMRLKLPMQAWFQKFKTLLLPLSECPTAPGQGALAIECRSSDLALQGLFQNLEHPQSALMTHHERTLLASKGGGCHQGFGVSFETIPGLGRVGYAKGNVYAPRYKRERMTAEDRIEYIEKMLWQPEKPLLSIHTLGSMGVWDPKLWKKDYLPMTVEDLHGVFKTPLKPYVYIAHSAVLKSLFEIPKHVLSGLVEADLKNFFEALKKASLWVPGISTWKKLTALGYHPQGCAEGYGFEWLRANFLQSWYEHLPLQEWTILTHKNVSQEHYQGIEDVRGCYDRAWNMVPFLEWYQQHADKHTLSFFWTSPSQWLTVKKYLSSQQWDDLLKRGLHACGPGRTACFFEEQSITPQLFPHIHAWRDWLQGKTLGELQ